MNYKKKKKTINTQILLIIPLVFFFIPRHRILDHRINIFSSHIGRRLTVSWVLSLGAIHHCPSTYMFILL